MKISANSFGSATLGTFFVASMLSLPAWAQYPQNQQMQGPSPTQQEQSSLQQQNPNQDPQQQPNQVPPNQQDQDQYQNQNPPNQHAIPPQPGAVNYVEGQANLDGRPLPPASVGSINLEKGQVVNTQAGKLEVLLTPGVFLRLADNSSAKMVS